MRYAKKSLSVLLILAMLAGFFLVPGAPKAAAATKCYSNYTVLDVIENYNGCTGAQGMAVDDTYIYNVKVNSSTEANAFITRTHRTTGATSYMTNTSTGDIYYTNLSHANDMDVVNIDGVKTMFISTLLTGENSLIRFTVNGTKLTQTGNYQAMLDGKKTSISGIQVVRVNGSIVDLMIKKNKYFYYGTLDTSKSSGQFDITLAFTLDVENVTVNGKVYDMTEWLHQGFEYLDHKVYVPLTGKPDMSESCIVIYDTQGATGTIRNDPNLSFYIKSSKYTEKFEFESCGICPSDGKLYFNTNQATSSSSNYDSILVFNDYVYDPSGGATESGVYRWETKDNALQSVTTGGAAYNGLAMSQGDITGTTFTSARFSFHEGVVLKHDEPWIVEWKGSGKWSNGALLMSSYNKSKYEGNRYIFRRQDSTLIALGEYSEGTYYNYGLNISDYGIDGSADHVYRITNKVNADGTNMAYLSVDGRELGPMNNAYLAGTSQGTTSDWISGKDFVFSYSGTDLHPLNDCGLEYIQVWGQGLLDQKDDPDTYRWESGMKAVSAPGLTTNTATALGGSVSGSTYTDSRYSLDQNVVLLHDRPWSVEWKSEGAWTGGTMLLAASAQSNTVNAPFLFRCQYHGVIALGYCDGTEYNNYGVSLEEKGIDDTAPHTYRLTNRIEADGSNMVYLYVDGVEIGSMTDYFLGSTTQNTTDNWVAGKDFTFSYIGTVQRDINTTLNYLQVWENGIPSDHITSSYRWETLNDTLTSITDGFDTNNLSQLAGSITGGTYSGTYFRLDQPVVLLHNLPWKIQWQSGGSFTDAASGTLLLSSSRDGFQDNATYLYRRNDSHIIAFGERADGYHQNYGIKLSDHGIDGTASHTYRLENRINEDGSNMVYLFVDDVELGAMNNHYKGGNAQNTTSDWVSGKDFVFSYVGSPDFPMGNCTIGYMQIQEDCIHSFGDWTLDSNTCTNGGTQTRTCVLCGATEKMNVSATGHSYTYTVTAPTCTDDGYTTYTCINCGDSFQSDATPATGHKYTFTVIAPNCVADGYTSYRCTVCGDTFQSDATPATGHKYAITVIQPTCATGGYTTYTCTACGDTFQSDETPASGHNYATTVIEPSCLTGGYTTHLCKTCGETFQSNETQATGHSYQAAVTAPTCTTGGYTNFTCTKCGHSYKDLITGATGHRYTGSVCMDCGAANPDFVATFYLIGYINGADHGCESDWENMGSYKFVNGKLTATFTEDSYVFLKSEGNSSWYMTHSYCTDTSATFYSTSLGTTEKMFVPGNVVINFTLTENADGSLNLSYTQAEAQVTEPTLTLKAPTLEFKDMITVNAFYTAENIQDVEEMGMITYSSKVTTWSVDTAENVIPGATYDEGTGRYYSCSQGIHGKFLGDTVYLAIYAKLKDGTYAYSKLAGYSAVQYATNQLKNSTNTALKQLVAAMLNYGAEAQLYFGHNTSALANASLTAEQKALPAAYNAGMVSSVPAADAAKQGIFANNQGFASRKPAVSFEGAFCINYFFTPNYAPSSGITLYYWNAEDYNAASVLTTANATGSLKLSGSGTGEHRGDITGIAAKELSAAVYVAAAYKDSNGTVWTSGVLGYSIGAYCSSQASKGGDISALAQATAVYGYHAKQYFG